MSEPTFPETFVVQRDEDVSGISGEGVVAEGVQFSDGWVVTHWLDRPPMNEPKTDVWHNKGAEPFEKIHGHGGSTRVLWAEQLEAVRQQLRAEVIKAFDVPPELCGVEIDAAYLREETGRRLLSAAREVEGPFQPIDYEVKVARFTDAVLPLLEGLLYQRDRAQAVTGRAYALADRWRAAHGSAQFLVRAAGAELRGVLDDSGVTSGEVVHSAENAQASGLAGVDASGLCCVCGDPVEWIHHPDDPGWIHAPGSGTTCLNARPRCPECQIPHLLVPGQQPMCRSIRKRLADADDGEDDYTGPLVPPILMEAIRKREAARTQHVGAVVATSTDDLRDVRQHYLGPNAEPCTKHRGRAERQRYGCNGPDPAEQGPPNQGPLTGIEVRDPCPHCEDCRLIPRTLMAAHIREHHPDVTVASHENGTAAATEATLAADESESAQRTRGQRLLDALLHRGPGYEIGETDRQACPYCPGGPMVPRRQLRMHVEVRHARVLAALASGDSLDELLHNAAADCDLPHEMEA